VRSVVIVGRESATKFGFVCRFLNSVPRWPL
jgi:hypothetical protein